MITGVTIGDLVINADEHYALVGEQGLSLPPVRLSSFNLAGQDFGRHVASFYGIRRYALDILVIGDSIADFAERRKAIHAAFHRLLEEQPVAFTLTDGSEVTLISVFVSIDFALKAGQPTAAQAHVELEAAYPFFTAAEASLVILTLGTTGGGTVPATVPMALNADALSSAIAANPGNAVAQPRLRLNGPITNPTVRNLSTGQELRFTITLGAGEYLDVDIQARTVVDQSGTNRFATASGDWWGLEPGDNVLALLADSNDPTSTAEVRFTPTYLAI
jgi:hypothetical protein